VIGSIAGNILLRQVPSALAAGVSSGEYRVYGSIIRSVSTGRVVAHLQETGGVARLLGSAPSMSPLTMMSSGIHIVQGEQIKAGVRHVQEGVDQLQQLGLANLALSGVGIGISVAGFAVIAAKINRLASQVDELKDRIAELSEQVKDLHEDIVLRDFDNLRAAAKDMDEIWLLESDGAAKMRWHTLAKSLLDMSELFRRRASRILAKGPGAVAAAEPHLDALALASGLRVASLAAAGEERAAQIAARGCGREIEALTGTIGAADLARERLREAKVRMVTQEWRSALEGAIVEVAPSAERLRQREASAATLGAPLKELEERGIPARDWLAAARQEEDVPVVLMMRREAQVGVVNEARVPLA
jgi:outer membrane murein-binding lipoprotein Lpp